jgi:hypothetical protein
MCNGCVVFEMALATMLKCSRLNRALRLTRLLGHVLNIIYDVYYVKYC